MASLPDLSCESSPPRLSLCMIVHNDASTLRTCLESIRPWVDEMVVVDTGSEDKSRDIARECGADVSVFPWCADFSAARNASLARAHGQWLFWMDSDDIISPENGARLRELVYGRHADDVLGYILQVHCHGQQIDGELESDIIIVDHVKLLKNHPDLRFEGRFQEQILPAIQRSQGQIRRAEVVVEHFHK